LRVVKERYFYNSRIFFSIFNKIYLLSVDVGILVERLKFDVLWLCDDLSWLLASGRSSILLFSLSSLQPSVSLLLYQRWHNNWYQSNG